MVANLRFAAWLSASQGCRRKNTLFSNRQTLSMLDFEKNLAIVEKVVDDLIRKHFSHLSTSLRRVAFQRILGL